tara:strand:+ start:355 stop:573 length:219 start_codon:yes stop_codon:yes gene_type:complete
MHSYKLLIKDIYTNEKRELEYSSPNRDPRLIHKEGLRKIRYEEDIEKVYLSTTAPDTKYNRLVYDKRKGFLD